MKHVDVKSSSSMESNKEIEDLKFEFGNIVEISKYKNILQEAIVKIDQKKFCDLKKVRNTISWTYFISDLNGEKIVGTFFEK